MGIYGFSWKTGATFYANPTGSSGTFLRQTAGILLGVVVVVVSVAGRLPDKSNRAARKVSGLAFHGAAASLAIHGEPFARWVLLEMK
jgi:hypothetical protein